MRRLALIAAAVWWIAAPGFAASFVYELELVGKGRVLARDYPVERGSVLLFHSYPTGTYTSVPAESVLKIRPRALDRTVRPLEPGETVTIGPTGAGEGRPDATVSAPRAPAQPAAAYPPYGYGAPYSYGSGPAYPRSGFISVQPSPGTDIGVNGFPAAGDLPRAASGAPPTMDTNGFPATSASSTPIGPNGFPVTSAAPGSPPTIAPNGFPAPPPGAPGSTPPTIGPNGFPAPPQPPR